MICDIKKSKHKQKQVKVLQDCVYASNIKRIGRFYKITLLHVLHKNVIVSSHRFNIRWPNQNWIYTKTHLPHFL